MADLTERVRTRLLPALLTAFGVTFLAVGLLSYGSPVDAGAARRPRHRRRSPASRARRPSSPCRRWRQPPPPTASPTFPADRVATRVRVAALEDRPAGRRASRSRRTTIRCATWPCTSSQLGQPGQGRATYLYAHARDGMFLPILTASLVGNGRKMIGMVVEVWTSDDKLFLYEIVEVRRHQLDLEDALDRDDRAALAADLRGPEGHAGQDAGHRRVPVRGGRQSRVGPSHAEAGGLRLDPVDPAQDHEAGPRGEGDAGRHDPESAGLGATHGGVASLMPKIPATAPMPARITVTPVSRFMITDRLLLTWVR